MRYLIRPPAPFFACQTDRGVNVMNIKNSIRITAEVLRAETASPAYLVHLLNRCLVLPGLLIYNNPSY